jgi:hypothetical protein
MVWAAVLPCVEVNQQSERGRRRLLVGSAVMEK